MLLAHIAAKRLRRIFHEPKSTGYHAEGRSYLTIAIGCTGGRHRSVAIVEEIADRLRSRGLAVRTTHRDVNR